MNALASGRTRRARLGRRTALPGIVCAGLAAFAPAWAASSSQPLDAGWQFRLAPGDAHAAAHPQVAHWLPATVPGTVQTDLLAAGLVADPFVGRNEASIQWVGLSDWTYRTRFQVDAATLARAHAALVFDGLDTFADVYLNGHKLLGADNMFRRWEAPAKRWLQPGVNTLEVRLHSPFARV